MTPEQIDAMEVGLLCDFEVAGALGMNRAVIGPQGGVAYCEAEGRRFSPSTDWNDAMHAAERFGLLDIDGVNLSRSIHPDHIPPSDTRGYEIMRDDTEIIVWDPSGPLCVCKAILKLSATVRA